MPIVLPKIHDILVVGLGNDDVDEISFEILGRPPVQNGWKMAWKRFKGHPYLYDPKKREKMALRTAVKAAVRELTRAQLPVFRNTLLSASVVFHIEDIMGKDLDNMAKFLNDALEGAIMDDDKFVVQLFLSKIPVGQNESESTMVKFSSVIAQQPLGILV
jgi:Holliday junction resolvase RusA-like endonuclease